MTPLNCDQSTYHERYLRRRMSFWFALWHRLTRFCGTRVRPGEVAAAGPAKPPGGSNRPQELRPWPTDEEARDLGKRARRFIGETRLDIPDDVRRRAEAAGGGSDPDWYVGRETPSGFVECPLCPPGVARIDCPGHEVKR